ncbi:radical SAM protein [Thermococcus gammatolerans]|uniref:Radical SAM protein, putative Fe-S oxidoreductase n=1 Tax=Thermococcus gammatolerans (strain DSM 15229 / JCM 11827 / EJ3) TaxID=593117 RepID=C5A4A8_THEGJ|nr:radical SAM protein [Thermococcus gammatolerans]ACS33070.1 Radical SAM protein, putative Fe-S oxidoreductase [Thermococcus gammatolerans EJ3]
MIAFGPVPSRRLGKSLGVNNIPDKVCSYACVYCQIGRTLRMEIERRPFYDPALILEEVGEKVEEARERGERIDYITFVPDGEPTLDSNLGLEVELLRDLGVPLAILTNSSLIWREDVRNDLLAFDFVSLKLDAVSEPLWRKVDRPHKALKLDAILEGMLEFRESFDGRLVTETMLIDGVNYEGELERIAEFLSRLDPDVAYIAVPTRPPAEPWVRPAREETINMAFQLFAEALGEDRVEYLIGYEGNAFAFTGNVEDDILSITSVHPMREDALRELLRKANADWDVVEKLLDEGKLIELEYNGRRFYMRRLRSREFR